MSGAMRVLNSRRHIVSSLTFAFLIVATARAVQAAPVPSPWVAQDIGAPAVSGSSSYSSKNKTFTISGAGSDVWGASDQFQFVYQQVTGDVDIVARVDSLLQTDQWSKAGVMIRSSLAAGAAHGFALVSAQNGIAFQWRAQVNGQSGSASDGTGTAPRWVRLVRAGTSLTAYTATDGATWTNMGSATIALGATAYVGLAVTSHNTSASTTAVISQTSITTASTSSLPTPQQDADIGAPAVAGSATFQQGTYTIVGSGNDIWGQADQFHYVYQAVTGDIDVSARVASLSGSDSWAKAGVMIRETLDPDSRHALALISTGNGATFQRRIDPGGFAVFNQGPSIAAPAWVRLVRSTNQFTGYSSTDGVTWTTIATDTVPMGAAVYVGLAVTSHTTSSTATAAIDQFKLSQPSAPPNQPPVVSVTAPTGGSTFTAPANITVSAQASDPENRLSRVDFFAGSTKIGSLTAAPFTIAWSSVPAGTYALTAAAFDLDGGSTTSQPVTVNVSSTPNQAPTVGLSSPSNGATFTAPATIAIAASAADPDGTVAKVEFYNGTTLLGTDTASPYSFSWPNVAAGNYTLKAIAYDNTGASTTSATVSVTVVTASTSLPAPQQDADVGAPALAGSATFNEGTYTIVGSGNDIWGQADQFNYLYQAVTGDIDVSARVASLQWSNSWAKAGVMIRETLDKGSRHAFALISGGNGATFQQRIDPGGYAVFTQGPLIAAPAWVRLVRSANQFTAYSSTDGVTWTTIATATITMGSTVYVGLAVTSHDASSKATATIDSFKSTQPSAPANQPPVVSIAAPAGGASFTAPANITVTVQASDPNGTVAKVELYNGTTLLGTDTTSPYSFSWTNVAAGSYTLKAIAYDNTGASTTSATVSVTVTAATSVPTTVSFQKSADHDTLVQYYLLEVFPAGSDPNTATATSALNLGKPTPDASGLITLNEASFFSALAPGSYIATVSAVGSGGKGRSTPVAFTR
jgi:regulation of enolase protein 1 (concanavalin A-like superfamily)